MSLSDAVGRDINILGEKELYIHRSGEEPKLVNFIVMDDDGKEFICIDFPNLTQNLRILGPNWPNREV